MIDEEKLIADIEYSQKWQNSPCPEWVICMIKSQSKRTQGRRLSEVLGTMFDEEEPSDVCESTFAKECVKAWKTMIWKEEVEHE